MQINHILCFGIAVFVLHLGCDDADQNESEETECSSGESADCPCDDGSRGTKICRDDTLIFGPCDCPAEAGGDADGDADADADTDSDADSDADSDGDTDTDGDTDADSDTDSDTDTDMESPVCKGKTWDGDYVVQSVEDLDAIAGYKKIDGALCIYSTETLQSLSALKCLEESDSLFIAENAALANLQGLEQITSLQSLRIRNNQALVDLGGLESLTAVGVDSALDGDWSVHDADLCNLDLSGMRGAYLIEINGNDNLRSIESLGNLTDVKWVRITDNPKLESLSGLEGIVEVGYYDIGDDWSLGGLTISGNNSLKDLTGLDNLEVIHSDLGIGNTQLTSLAGLEKLSSVYGFVDLSENAKLKDLSGLNNLVTVSNGLSISGNPVLESLVGLESLAGVGGVWCDEADYDLLDLCIGGLELSGNHTLTDLKDLESLSYVAWLLVMDTALTSLAGLEKIESIGAQVIIRDNKQLVSLDGVDNLTRINGALIIDNNLLLQNLDKLDSLTISTEFWIVGPMQCLQITDNPTLSNCEANELYERLTSNPVHNLVDGCTRDNISDASCSDVGDTNDCCDSWLW